MMKTFLLASSAVWKVPLWFLKSKIFVDLKGSAWCLLIWKVVIYRTYDENFPSSLISGVKILADLKGSVRLDVGWFEKLSLFNLDSRCAALIGGQAQYLYFLRTGKLLFIRWLAKDTRCIIIFKKVSQARSFSREVWVEKEVDAHLSTRSKLLQKCKIDIDTLMYKVIKKHTRAQSWCRNVK